VKQLLFSGLQSLIAFPVEGILDQSHNSLGKIDKGCSLWRIVIFAGAFTSLQIE